MSEELKMPDEIWACPTDYVYEDFDHSDVGYIKYTRADLVDAQNKEALEALEGMIAIVGDSTGVDGFHLNGDIATWAEFDEEIQASYAAIAKARGAQ